MYNGEYLKGNAVTAMIGIMVGAIIVFAVIVPIVNNALSGTLYENEDITNTTIENTTQILSLSCYPLNTNYLNVTNSTDSDITSDISILDADTGLLAWTNTTVDVSDISATYRCLDSNYIVDNNARTLTNFLIPLLLVILIVGLTAFIIK